MKPDSQIDAIRREAEQWLARRHGRAARASLEEDAFHRWLQADPRHREAYSASERLWQEYRQLGTSARLNGLRQQAMTQSRREHRRRWPRALAAGMALAVAAGAYLAWTSVQVEVQHYATVLGEQRTVQLSDRSELLLNTDTVLEVRFSRARREVVLTRGEARFHVAGNRNRPFVVRAQGVRVTALGTQFQVRRDADRTLVTLAEGSVQVSPDTADTARVLMPNQQAVLQDGRGKVLVRAVDAGREAIWTTGRLDFQALPLGEVVQEANRYSAHKLKLGDASIADTKVSGNFLAGDNLALAKGLEVVLPIEVDRRPDGSIVLHASR